MSWFPGTIQLTPIVPAQLLTVTPFVIKTILVWTINNMSYHRNSEISRGDWKERGGVCHEEPTQVES